MERKPPRGENARSTTFGSSIVCARVEEDGSEVSKSNKLSQIIGEPRSQQMVSLLS